MLDRLYTSLSHIALAASGDNPNEPLAVAVRDARALLGADLVVLCLPDGPSGGLEIRVPEGMPWPPPSLLLKWAATAAKTRTAFPLAGRDRPRRPPMLGGMILPVFGPRGSVGIVGVFSASRAAFSVEQCAVLMVLVQSALGRAEGVQLQQMAEEATAAEVHARLARDIHDGPLQTLLSATLRLRAALAKDRKRPRESLQVLERELAQTARQMRTLIRTLRLARSQGTIEERLKAALSRLKQAKGLTWTLRWRAPERLLQAAVADEIFRVVNEALANVYRHSCAKRVGVMSRRQGNTFEVIVRDDGIGFNVAEGLRRDISRKSFGLISMQERVAALGGTFTLRSQAGRGTRVLIRLPLRQDEKEMDKTA